MPRPQQEMIRSGGFAGGVSAGAAQAQPSGLSQLAEALGVAVPRAQQAMVDGFTNRVNKKKETAQDDAKRLLNNELLGYNAKQIGEWLDSEPAAAIFKKNPYILPAIKVHQGRLSARDLTLNMVNSGVDPGDQEGVAAFLQENRPDDNDKFFSRGFYEEVERYQSQFVAQQMKDKMTEMDYSRRTMAGDQFNITFRETGDAQVAVDALMQTEDGLNRAEKSKVLYEKAQQFAYEGNVEAFEALMNATRKLPNGAELPTLAEDAEYASEMQRLYKNVKAERYRQEGEQRIEWVSQAFEDIEAGKYRTYESLKRSDIWQSLEIDKSNQLRIEERWRSWQDGENAKAARAGGKAWQAVQEKQALTDAVDKLKRGEGYLIFDVNSFDPESGASYNASAQTLRNKAVTILRKQRLGEEDPWNVGDPQQAANFDAYVSSMNKSGLHDESLRSMLNGTRDVLTTEAIQGREAEVAKAFSVWERMDPQTSAFYVTDKKTEAVYSEMSRLKFANPQMDPAEMARVAVARANNPFTPSDYSEKRTSETLQPLEIVDYGNTEKSGFLFWSKDKPVSMEHPEMWEGLRDEAQLIASQLALENVKPDQMQEAVQNELLRRYTSVNGMPVEIPGWASGTQTPEAWNTTVHQALKGIAMAYDLGDDTSGLRITSLNGTYMISHADGKVPAQVLKPENVVAAALEYRSEMEAKGANVDAQDDKRTEQIQKALDKREKRMDRLKEQAEQSKGIGLPPRY